jgi:hypothetical protein
MSVALHAAASDATEIGLNELGAILGVASDTLPCRTRTALAAADFGFTPLHGDALAAVEGRVQDALRAPLPISGPGRQPAWEAGWGDILDRFAKHDDLDELEPHYFRKPSLTMRLLGRYVRPHDARFEASCVKLLQAWIAERYLEEAAAIYEFGCGPGHNVLAFARLLPGRPIVGLDWAQPSQEILTRVARETAAPISGRRFDMFAPDPELKLAPGSAVVTIGAMEQLGERFAPFLDFLLTQAPRICVHLEPIHELYVRACPFDDVAARYAERRGYLRGFLPRLQTLAAKGKIELLVAQRHFGSEFHDGWGSLVWRPRHDRNHRGETTR